VSEIWRAWGNGLLVGDMNTSMIRKRKRDAKGPRARRRVERAAPARNAKKRTMVPTRILPQQHASHQTTWNDILRATYRPRLEADGEHPIVLSQPPNFPQTIPIHRIGYNTAFLRTLPEFSHWNDPSFGEEAFSYDAYMLRARVSIVDLSQRGAMTTEWYDTDVPLGVLEGRCGELKKEAEGYREVIRGYLAIADRMEWDVIGFFVKELERVEERLERCEGRRMRRLQRVGQVAVLAAASERGWRTGE
jgi:hypothetical protein